MDPITLIFPLCFIGVPLVIAWLIHFYCHHINIHRLSTGEYVVRKGYGEWSAMYSSTYYAWLNDIDKRLHAKRFRTKKEAKAFIVLLKDFL